MSIAGRKVTFVLTSRGAGALHFCQDKAEATITETINDALRLYAMVLSKPDAQLLLRDADGQMERILLP